MCASGPAAMPREGRYDQQGVPGECALAQHFCVGRVTVRKAMD
jgi:DNA-binding GntR family transcriptional regulator